MFSESTLSSTRRPRLYVGTACDQCFRTKARCAGEKPTCKRCQLNDTSCTYSTGRRKKGTAAQKGLQSTDNFIYIPSGPRTISSLTPHSAGPDPSGRHADRFDMDAPLQTHEDAQEESILYPQRVPYARSLSDTLKFPDQPLTESSSLSFENERWDEQTDLHSTRSNGQPLDALSFTFPEEKLCDLELRNWLGEQHTQLGRGGELQSQSQPQPQSQNVYPQQHQGVQGTGFPTLLDMTGGSGVDSKMLGQTLARLHGYDLGISVASPDETLAQLQQSLAMVGSYISNAEAAGRHARSGSRSGAGPPTPLLQQQNNLAVAMTCFHTIQLVFACYVKMRRRHGFMPSAKHCSATSLGEGELQVTSATPDARTSLPTPPLPLPQQSQPPLGSPPCPRADSAPPVSDTVDEHAGEQQNAYLSLLDFYISRDMRACQSLAERLTAWCYRLTLSIDHEQGQHAPEAVVAINAMVAPLETCALMSL